MALGLKCYILAHLGAVFGLRCVTVRLILGVGAHSCWRAWLKPAWLTDLMDVNFKFALNTY